MLPIQCVSINDQLDRLQNPFQPISRTAPNTVQQIGKPFTVWLADKHFHAPRPMGTILRTLSRSIAAFSASQNPPVAGWMTYCTSHPVKSGTKRGVVRSSYAPSVFGRGKELYTAGTLIAGGARQRCGEVIGVRN